MSGTAFRVGWPLLHEPILAPQRAGKNDIPPTQTLRYGPLVWVAMTDFEPQEDLPPVAHVTIVYNGPVAPHWDLRVRYGDQKLTDDFWARVNARLLLLPKHDPQFRRNKERVNRDAERERIICDWDLGDDDADTSITPVAEPVVEMPAESVAPVESAAEDTSVDAEVAVEADEEVEATESEAVESETVADDGDGDAVEGEAGSEESAEGEENDVGDEGAGDEAVAETADA